MVDLPTVEFCNSFCATGIQYPEEVCQNGLPHTKLEFMHQVDDEQGEYVEVERGQG